MIRVVAATRNRGKAVELSALLAGLGLEVVSAVDLPGLPEVEEDAPTFAGNARKKALAVARAAGLPALADDSGLEVDALQGAPGVHSARFAGVDGGEAHARDAANNARLLAALADLPPEGRRARFRCAVAFADPEHLGERTLEADGVCEGVILDAPRGGGGFGYDPLFRSLELGETFAEASLEAKQRISHRGRAFTALVPLLRGHFLLHFPTGLGRNSPVTKT